MSVIQLEDSLPGYDITIIGAGPAGCAVARKLSKKFKVLLVDYKALPRKKSCGGLLVKQAIDELKRFSDDESFITSPNPLDLEYVDLDSGTNSIAKKGFYNIDREKFDAFLLSLVPEEAHVCQKTKLADFTSTKDKAYQVLILESNGTVKPIVTKYLIGADGALSEVRNKISNKQIPYYLAIQEKVKGSKINKAIFIYKNEITDFYSWIIPKSDGILIGSAVNPVKSREKFKQFKKLARSKYGLSNNGHLDSAVILRPESSKDIFLGKGHVMLVGEAAGLISPSSGEGISFALESGRVCAEALIESPNSAFESYKKKVKPAVERVLSKIGKSKKIKSEKGRTELMK